LAEEGGREKERRTVRLGERQQKNVPRFDHLTTGVASAKSHKIFLTNGLISTAAALAENRTASMYLRNNSDAKDNRQILVRLQRLLHNGATGKGAFKCAARYPVSSPETGKFLLGAICAQISRPHCAKKK
jgi:hypothetical protein